MKHFFLFLLNISLLASCNTKAKKEKQELEDTSRTSIINHIVGVGKISPETEIVQLSSPVSGIVEKFYKKENDTVSIGSVILELEHHLEDEKIIQLQNELSTQAAQIKVDEAGVDEFKAKVSNATSDLKSALTLLEEASETQQTVDNKTTDLKTLKANLKRSEAGVNVAKGRRQELISALKSSQLERQQKIIRSPIKGGILELTVLIGGSVSVQQAFGQISPEGKIIAICEIDEANADKIALGQKGWIRNVGSSDTLSKGTVYFAAAFLKKKSLFTDQSGEKEDRRVRTLKMMLDKPEKLLLNARVECVININGNTMER
jgi:multidrug efflux pump subunit AcrA (membrane-fusion protein)